MHRSDCVVFYCPLLTHYQHRSMAIFQVFGHWSSFFIHNFLPFMCKIDKYKIVVDVKASGPPHVLKLLFGVSNGMLPVKYFQSNISCFLSVEFH